MLLAGRGGAEEVAEDVMDREESGSHPSRWPVAQGKGRRASILDTEGPVLSLRSGHHKDRNGEGQN